MKAKYSFVAAAVSLTALAASTAAQAQQTGEAASGNLSSKTSTDAAPVSAADQSTPTTASSSSEDIVVTGYRRSLQSAQEQKRSSSGIVDAIVSDDIGKLPDNNAAEAIARITGVQVSRYNDEAGDVFVRGLTDVTTTFNGRELFSADDRKLHLQDFPAGVAAGIEVYKSGTADLIEPGLAGLINLRSRRPLDIKDLTVAGEVRASYNDQSKAFDPAGNILLTKRWNTPIGEIGALINFSYVRSTYRDADRYVDSNPITPAGYTTNPADDLAVQTPGVGTSFTLPNAVGNYYSKGVRQRPAVNGTLQWRPSGNLEVYVEGLWQAYRGVETIDSFGLDLGRTGLDGSAGTLSNVVVQDGKAISLTKSGGYSPTFGRAAQNDRTDTYQAATGFKWNTGRATITGDFAYTSSRYHAHTNRVDGQFFSVPTTDIVVDAGGSSIFNLGNYASNDPANYQWSGYDQNFSTSKGSGVQGRVDLDLDTDIDWLPKLQFGVRATDHKATVVSGDRYASVAGLGLTLAGLPTGGLEQVTDGFGDDAQQFRTWLEPSRANVAGTSEAMRLASVAALQQLAAANPNDVGIRQSLAAYQSNTVPTNISAGYHADEKSYAVYGQARYALTIAGIPIDGVAGTRVVITDGTYSGFSQIADQSGALSYVPRSSSNNYVDILPAFQSRIHFTPKLQMRLAFTETRTRPGFGQLNPALNITRATPAAGGAAVFNAFGSSGNPDLKPLTSKNYDATLEWYFSRNGSISVAGFHHDLKGFIANYTTNYTDPVYGFVQLSRPENAGEGHITGAEASVQTFFDFLPGWLSGFGAQVNGTYIEGTNAQPAALGENGRVVPITGVSKWTYNLTGFYEKGGLSIRASYNYRSHFVDGYSSNLQNQQLAEVTRGISRLDLSASYELTKGISVVANVSNLLRKPFNNYRYFNETQYLPRDLRIEGRYASAGVRFKL